MHTTQHDNLRPALVVLLALLLFPTLACADIVGDICARGGGADTFDRVLASLRQLQSSPRVTVRTIGHTTCQRPIPLLLVRDPQIPLEKTVRIFIIARQHGTEASGTHACLAIARHFADTCGEMETALLRQISFLLVPVANPDGMCAGRRVNGGGVDLNRDWGNCSQPETRAIAQAVKQHQPHAVLDLHELPAATSKPAFRDNFMQTIGRDSRLASGLTSDCATASSRVASWMSRCGLPLNVYFDSAGEDLKLCHRFFGLGRGIPSYLLEAKCGLNRPLAERLRFQVLGALVVANCALHRHYEGDDAAEPPADTAPPVPASSEGSPVVSLSSPKDGQVARGQLPIVATVAGLPAGGYVSFAVDGSVRSLTNASPHEYLLNTKTCADGRHEILVEIYDAAGRTLHSAQSVIVVDNATAAGE